ncbi:RNA pseudouridine synthase 5 isoform X4 [Silene latifolia]|uniref:RNA pseudouridine synthase 5 isoform X4 n=1 Tax=Silene latifolia TaxID=37657 RepID=UPI003D77F395
MQTIGEAWPEFNGGLTYNDVVSASHSGLTLIQFYSSKYTSSAPLHGWLQRIHNKQIMIDGETVIDPNTILRVGSELVYHRLPWKEPEAPYLLEVLYEDDAMIALNKPSGLQVLPGGLFQQRTVLSQLQWHANKTSKQRLSREPHPVPVHRLGRGTSGVLLCAKTKHAKTCLAAYFADGTSLLHGKRAINVRERKITKIYRALVKGIINENEIEIDQPIGTMRYPGVSRGLYVALPSGKPALSKVGVVERDVQKDQTWVKVEIQSGRPHQIRIHLSYIGHPLLGDPLYVAGGQPQCSDMELVDESYAEDGGYQRPSKPVPGDIGYHLHAHEVILSHPTTNEVMKILAPLPSMLKSVHELTGC